MHMENIEPLLKKIHLTMPVPVSNTEDPDKEPEDKELEDEEVEELQSLQKTLTKSYIDWLWLMVAHFDAI